MNAKRVISIILTAAIVLGLMATGASVAFAETYVDFVDLSGLVLTPGEALPMTLTTGEYGEVTSVNWEKWNFTTHSWEPIMGNVEDGSAYRVTAHVDAKPGYEFDTGLRYSINGKGDYCYAYGDGTYVSVEHALPVGLELVDEVEFATIPEVEVGVMPESINDQLTVAADAPYVVVNIEWYRVEGHSKGAFDGFFQINQCYQLETDLAPKPGYWLNAPYVVNDVYTYNQEPGNGTMWVEIEYRTTTAVDKAELTVTGFEKGGKAADVKVELPEDANYTVEYCDVCDSDWDTFDGTFENDVYKVEIRLVPAENYHFLDDMEVTVNGEEPDSNYGGADYHYVRLSLDLAQPIDKVELPAWPEIKAGDPVPAPTPVTPEGANYSYSLMFLEYRDGTIAPVGDTFKAGAAYIAMMGADPAKGYKIAEDCILTVGGKDPGFRKLGSASGIGAVKMYVLGKDKMISEIKLTGPAPTADKAPGEIKSTGTGYSLVDYDWGINKDGNHGKVTDPGEVFLVGEHVYLGVEVEMEDGYELNPLGQVVYNGKSYDMIMGYTRVDGNTASTAIYLGQLKEPVNPNTGDEMPVTALVVLAVASILGMGIVVARRKAF